MRFTVLARALAAAAALTTVFGASAAYAVPSFARQTGMPCSGCHAAGFYPELNAFGRFFKMHGYTMSAHAEQPYEPYPPLSAAQMWSYTHTNQSQPGLTKEPTLTFASPGNDNVSYPQQASFFLAGRFFGPVGGFVMGTYDGVDNNWAFDNTDIRITDTRDIDSHNLTYGLTFNNGPSVQDAWNTLPAWSQYIGSEIAPGPAAAVSMSNLGAQVSGIGAYALVDDLVYAEVTPYFSYPFGERRGMNWYGACGAIGRIAPVGGDVSRPTASQRGTRSPRA